MKWAFHPSESRPLIVISCNGRPLKCILDTGFTGYLWMDSYMAGRYNIVPDVDEFDANTAGGVQTKYKVGFIKSALIADLLFEDVPVHVHGGHRHIYALLGVRALTGLILKVDFNEGFTEILLPSEL